MTSLPISAPQRAVPQNILSELESIRVENRALETRVIGTIDAAGGLSFRDDCDSALVFNLVISGISRTLSNSLCGFLTFFFFFFFCCSVAIESQHSHERFQRIVAQVGSDLEDNIVELLSAETKKIEDNRK
jgi:hypothetical protein